MPDSASPRWTSAGKTTTTTNITLCFSWTTSRRRSWKPCFGAVTLKATFYYLQHFEIPVIKQVIFITCLKKCVYTCNNWGPNTKSVKVIVSALLFINIQANESPIWGSKTSFWASNSAYASDLLKIYIKSTYFTDLAFQNGSRAPPMLAIKKYYRHIAELHESNLVNMYNMKQTKSLVAHWPKPNRKSAIFNLKWNFAAISSIFRPRTLANSS